MKKDSPLWLKSLVIIGIFILVLTIIYVMTCFTYLHILSQSESGTDTPAQMIYYGICFNILLTIIFGYNIYLNTKK